MVAIERKDGAVKRVWLRYQNKLKGMPLEYVRLAVVEEQEAADIARESLMELEKQLETGRVNAEQRSSSSSSSSTSSDNEELPSASTGPGKQVARKQVARKQVARKQVAQKPKPKKEKSEVPLKVDPMYPSAEFSDEEQTQAATQETIQKASSNLDDVPISIHQKQVPSELASSARPQKKPRTDGRKGDPAL